MQFSVIIPVYNGEYFITKCVKSILKQNFEDYEVILVDDGSTDRTYEVCMNLKILDNRIRVLHKENGGVTSARKLACIEAKGKYIVCIDCDDYIQDDYFSNLNDLLIKNDFDAVVCDYYEMNNGMCTVRKSNLEEGLYEGHRKDDALSRYIYDETKNWSNYGTIPFALWCKVFKTELFRSAQLEINDNLVWGEDLLLTYKIFKSCNNFYVSKCCGYVYVINQKSVTHKFSLDSVRKVNVMIEVLCDEFWGDNRVFAFALDSLLGQIGYAAASSKNYKSFYKILIEMMKYTKLWECAYKAKIHKCNFVDYVKKFLFINHMYRLLYYAYSVVGKRI